MPARKPVKPSSVLPALRRICLALPDTTETLTWGEPHFRVADKIFCGCGEENGSLKIGFKLQKDHAAAILGDPRFSVAPYVGRYGWVSMDAAGITSWSEVEPLVHESYQLIAPKASLAKLGKGKARRAAELRPDGVGCAATQRRGRP
jgi:predicted DNA-binding protein (MmcQ/YjbR family)